MSFYTSFKSVSICPHHLKQNVCGTRAKYRDGKKETAVKVYTINQESVYLLIANVPALGVAEELRALLDQYGILEEFQFLAEYPSENFTESYLAKYSSFPPARYAKKKLDDESFYGNVLHVCYAPEFETVHETRMKLQDRRKYIAWKTKKDQPAEKTTNTSENPISEKKNSRHVVQPVTYVWAGKEYTVYPEANTSTENSFPEVGRSLNLSSGDFAAESMQKRLDQSGIGSSRATESYSNTISHIRQKVNSVSVPNMRVSLKRKRRV